MSSFGKWDGFDWEPIPSGRRGPRRNCASGWIYVVEFDFGIVKVGQSIDPRKRIQGHIKNAMRFGGTATQFWYSPDHERWMSNEALLIAWSFQRGRQTFGEYFADLDYEETVEYAQTLDFSTEGADQLPNNVIHLSGRRGA